MHRVTLTGLLCLLAVAAPVTAAESLDGFDCGRDIVRTVDLHQAPEGKLPMQPPTLARRLATIQLYPGTTLSNNAAALQAWNDAVALWESVLGDNVTVRIVGDLQNLGPGILGSTSSSTWQAPYADVRDLVVADRAADEGIAASLPTAAQFDPPDLPNFPVGFTYDGLMRATRAQLSALGVDMDAINPFNPGTGAGADATIIFSTDYLAQYDYDPTNGIGAGKIDFFAIVVHEIGHALGFTSSVDVYDYYVNQATPVAYGPTAVDLFRLFSGQGAANFSTATRIQTHGGEAPVQVFYDGITERLLSTGAFNGDGRQASHWKADELNGGNTIGIMDPTLSSGIMGKLTNSDLRLLGLIGWDVVPLADCNGNDIGDQFDIWNGDEQDLNFNGVPDACEATSAPEVRNAVVTIAPNPFNPRTEIRLALSADSHAKVNVYDMAGRHVVRLADRGLTAGEHSLIWEGKDSTGRGVSSGVYFVMVDIDGQVQQHKVALVR